MVDHVLVNLQRNLSRLDRLQDQLSSGKRVRYPSDDPASASLAMRLHSAVLENEQYLRNADAATGWLTTTDAALQDMVQTLHRARELIIEGARGDLPAAARQALAEEMQQLVRHLMDLGNAQHAGRYVFAGFATRQPPLSPNEDPTTGWITSVSFAGDNNEFEVEVGPAVRYRVGIAASQVFGVATSGQPTKLFDDLIAARDALQQGVTGDLSGLHLQNLEDNLDRLLQALDRVGARQQGLELVARRLGSDEVNLKDLLSRAEDLDVAEAIMELKMQENVYRLALASGARIIQPTLLDFLR